MRWEYATRIREGEDVEYDTCNPVWIICHTVSSVITLITRSELSQATQYHKLTVL